MQILRPRSVDDVLDSMGAAWRTRRRTVGRAAAARIIVLMWAYCAPETPSYAREEAREELSLMCLHLLTKVDRVYKLWRLFDSFKCEPPDTCREFIQEAKKYESYSSSSSSSLDISDIFEAM